MKRNTKSLYVADFATAIKRELKRRRKRSPPISSLIGLCEVLFFSSLKTDELAPIRCTVTYINPKNPDPSPPERILADRWSVTAFDQSIPFNQKNLSKLAKASDPLVSAIAVYRAESNQLFMWGLIDQQHNRAGFASLELNEGAENPGWFSISILGVGHLAFYLNYTLLGTLRHDELVSKYYDVLKSGPIHDKLKLGMDVHLNDVKSRNSSAAFSARGHRPDSFRRYWIRALSRILLGIQRYGHGGAVLLANANSARDVQLKYPLRYTRLPDALIREGVHTISSVHANDKIQLEYLDHRSQQLPTILYLDYVCAEAERIDTSDEITGCLRFISSLSRVDGLVLLEPNLAGN